MKSGNFDFSIHFCCIKPFSDRQKYLSLLKVNARSPFLPVRLLLYVIPRIVSATFLSREWVVHSSEEKEKVAGMKYRATV